MGDLAESLAHLSGPDRVRLVGEQQVLVAPRPVARVVLRAVLDNALKFSGPHGAVEFASACLDARVEIRVRDHGPGIDDAALRQAFEPFSQYDHGVTRVRGGLGLGLFAATRVAQRIRATIELARHPDGGTVATISIPQGRATDRTVPPTPRVPSDH